MDTTYATAAPVGAALPPSLRCSQPAAPPLTTSLGQGCLGGLLLWLAQSGLVEAPVLAAAGLDAAELARLQAEHGAQLVEVNRLLLCGDYLTREHVARLLRPRLTELCLASATPVDAARMARALRWLPDWVWTAGDPQRTAEHRPGGLLFAAQQTDAALLSAEELQLLQAELAERSTELGEAGLDGLVSELLSSVGPAATPTDALNRAARRRLAKLMGN